MDNVFLNMLQKIKTNYKKINSLKNTCNNRQELKIIKMHFILYLFLKRMIQ